LNSIGQKKVQVIIIIDVDPGGSGPIIVKWRLGKNGFFYFGTEKKGRE